MWILACWEAEEIILEPTPEQLITAIMRLNNREHSGVSLFLEREDVPSGHEARMIAQGGDRLYVEYWQEGSATPDFYLADLTAAGQPEVSVQMGSGVEFTFPATGTVPRETAIQVMLHFLNTRQRHPEMAWVRIADNE